MNKVVALVAASLIALVMSQSARAEIIWNDGRWNDTSNATVWIEDRGLWWQPDTGHYWKEGYWRDGDGRYWTPQVGWFWWGEQYAPAPLTYSYGSGVEQWRPLVASIFPGYAVNTVLRIMACESGGDPNATGWAGERGLMQVHPSHYDSTYDPYLNLLAAYRISNGGNNWGPWTCY